MNTQLQTPSASQVLELPSYQDLCRLVVDDPEAFETLRRALIERFINSHPEESQSRLRGIQFRVDGARQLSRSALDATAKLHDLMWKSFVQMNHDLQEFIEIQQRSTTATRPGPQTKPLPKQNARILEFKPRSRCDEHET